MNIFFDLDGTLIDSKMRLYQLFQYLIPQSLLTYEQYWNLKQQKINHSTILKTKLNFSENEVRQFEKKWMLLIEQEEWLKYDKPFNNVTSFLISLNKLNNRLFIVTARQSKINTINQIKSFGWLNLFEEILVTEQKNEKSELIKKYLDQDTQNWIIGDTGKDVETGKKINIKTAAVLSGFLNKDVLIKYNPDKIVNSVIELKF